MESYSCPPWKAGADESEVAASAAFSRCEQALEAFTSRASGKISEQQYSISKTWGKVLRAKVTFSHGGYAGSALVICWSSDGPGVQMSVEIEGCGSQQAGC